MSPPSELSREEIAKREIGHTDIRPVTAWTLTVAFLATIVVVPTVQAVHELRQAPAGRLPRCCSLFGELPEVIEPFQNSGERPLNGVLSANSRLLKSIQRYERQLEDESLLGKAVLPPLQHQLSLWGGAGNEQAYLGRDGWLFYRPGVDYLTGPGFLESTVLFRRSQSGNSHTPPPQPDPRSAILDFHRQLHERGIQLVLLPAPVKAALEPEHLSSRYAGHTSVLQNPSYDEFRRQM
ncbi:MAG TPA: hypothetical protein VHB77_17345, partial [Planctomycetaceae bacterium]|nr:hypothetical protein [Planctomycetaceae bacterium]